MLTCPQGREVCMLALSLKWLLPYVTSLPLRKPCVWVGQVLFRMPSLISAIPPVPNHVSVRQRQSLHFRDEKSEAQRSYSLSVTAPALELRFPDSHCSRDIILSPTSPSSPNSLLQMSSPPNPLSPGLTCCHTHEKASEGDSSVFTCTQWEWN